MKRATSAGQETLQNVLQGDGAVDDPADRALLGQILTFASFLGGLSLAAMVELMGQASGSNGAAQQVVVVLLGATGTSSLIGAFFALLGSIHAGRLLERRARLRYHVGRGSDEATTRPIATALARAVAAVLVFRQSARMLAVLGMATGLASALMLLYVVIGVAALGFFVVALIVMILPWIAISLLRARLQQIAPTVWAQAVDPAAEPVGRAEGEASE